MKLKIPKENANDDFVTISKIFVQDGQLVQQGDLLLEFETSKATIEYEASISGVIYFENIEIGTQMNVDTVFGEILKEPKKNKTKLSKTKL